MSQLLIDLYYHQAWADAEHWRTILLHPVAADDEPLRQRLYHLHVAQRAFFLIVRGEAIRVPKPEEFPSTAAIRNFARDYHAEALPFVRDLAEPDLARQFVIPWFKDPPIRITAEQALAQAAMHSQHHRAQNAARLRELGIEPPTTDLIMWYWKERPAARWE